MSIFLKTAEFCFFPNVTNKWTWSKACTYLRLDVFNELCVLTSVLVSTAMPVALVEMEVGNELRDKISFICSNKKNVKQIDVFIVKNDCIKKVFEYFFVKIFSRQFFETKIVKKNFFGSQKFGIRSNPFGNQNDSVGDQNVSIISFLVRTLMLTATPRT